MKIFSSVANFIHNYPQTRNSHHTLNNTPNEKHNKHFELNVVFLRVIFNKTDLRGKTALCTIFFELKQMNNFLMIA